MVDDTDAFLAWLDSLPKEPNDKLKATYAAYKATVKTAPDLMAELVDALETAHECLLWCAREGRMASPSLSRYPERWAENLALKLAKIKGGV